MAHESPKTTANRPAYLLSNGMSTLLPQVFEFLGGRGKGARGGYLERDNSGKKYFYISKVETKAAAHDVGTCQDFVSCVVASRLLSVPANASAARRCRALWSTSTEAELRGLRLGALFLARRTRVRREDPEALLFSRNAAYAPLASNTQWIPNIFMRSEEENDALDVWFKDTFEGPFDPHQEQEPPFHAADMAMPPESHFTDLADHFFFVDVLVKTHKGIVVDRRSVMVDVAGLFSSESGIIDFDPLVVATHVNEAWTRSEDMSKTPDDYRLAAKSLFGWRHPYGSEPPMYHETVVKHDLGRVVSVRVDFFRVSDGKSMCLLGEHDVGFVDISNHPTSGLEYPDDAIFLRAGRDTDIETSLLPGNGYGSRGVFTERMHCQPAVVMDMPTETDDVFRLRAVQLGFTTSMMCEVYEGRGVSYPHHLGAIALRGLRALDAWQ